MPKLLQINPVIRTNTSTGRIMREIGDLAMAHGWESYVAFSAGRDGKDLPCTSRKVPVGGKLSVAVHGLWTRLTDRHGLASNAATRRFIRQIEEEIKPDIIHIHNLHGYFLNYRLFFDWLSRSGIPTVWTVHDCWLYTGHCYYYSAARCDRWKTGCGACPQRKKFPRSWLVDASKSNHRTKRESFAKVPKEMLTFVPVSQWMRDQMGESFLRDFPLRVIHNGLDLSVFAPSVDCSEVVEKYSLQGRKVFLGVASVWSEEKGLADFLKLSNLLDKDEVIVLVGLPERQLKTLPANIIGIERTADAAELAKLYSAASVFLNPTWQDNYPTVNLEALACGTPVVTYRTGGSAEAISPETGMVVEQGDVAGLLEAARFFAGQDKDSCGKACRIRAESYFCKNDRYSDYLRLYGELLEKTH